MEFTLDYFVEGDGEPILFEKENDATLESILGNTGTEL
jgi:hypothetical protein